jgi:beta-N-acetylhexosaminidase
MIKSFICGVAGTSLNAAEREFLAREQPYGVILFARNIESPAQVRALVSDIKSCLTHPFASILIDQEGGRVARLRPPHWRAYPPALTLARGADAARAIYVNARLIAQELRELGITTDCAPLADVLAEECHAVIGDRAFGDDAKTVAELARAQADGLRDGGILPVLKHIPGHGRATCDSHEDLPVVSASLAALEASDFVPFRALADLPLAMTAHIIYEALDAKRCATLSPTVIAFIRENIGFNGLLMSDDLSMKALTGSYESRAEQTLAAGCDLVLHCNGNMDEMTAIASHCTPLAGEALARAVAAHASRLAQLPGDDAALLAEWQQFLAVA